MPLHIKIFQDKADPADGEFLIRSIFFKEELMSQYHLPREDDDPKIDYQYIHNKDNGSLVILFETLFRSEQTKYSPYKTRYYVKLCPCEEEIQDPVAIREDCRSNFIDANLTSQSIYT